jgi:hypothetical protein
MCGLSPDPEQNPRIPFSWLWSDSETVFLNFQRAQASIPPAYVAWRAGTATLFLLGSKPL